MKAWVYIILIVVLFLSAFYALWLDYSQRLDTAHRQIENLQLSLQYEQLHYQEDVWLLKHENASLQDRSNICEPKQ